MGFKKTLLQLQSEAQIEIAFRPLIGTWDHSREGYGKEIT